MSVSIQKTGALVRACLRGDSARLYRTQAMRMPAYCNITADRESYSISTGVASDERVGGTSPRRL